MDTFDRSLKHLLAQEPQAFFCFGLGHGDVVVLAPVPTTLPARGRDVDGGYLILDRQRRKIGHLEFHRRHQRHSDLAIDVAEAQVRFYRRERLEVFSLVFDLYGRANEPVLSRRVLRLGEGSQITYHRVNLRGMAYEELLAQGPPAFWPLVPLARGGASGTAVRRAREAIEGRTDLPPDKRADHLAVLWFVAEAEDVPVSLMKALLTKERMMESALYREIFSDGQQDGLSGMRQVVAEMCELAGIELTLERRAQIEAMGKEQLLLLARRIKERRAW